MKTRLLLSVITLTAGLSIVVNAQTQQQDHQEHHPGGPPPQSQPVTPPAPSTSPPAAQTPSPPEQPQMPMDMGQMMQRMPEQCRAMMQNMPQNCMSTMHQMMQGHMSMPGRMQAQPSSQSSATKAYMEAAGRMHGPMLAGLQTDDPDVAFVRAMIAHHQGAIDLAKVVLQYGKDDQAKKWANDVIRDQQREISEMEDWLKKNTPR